MDIEVGDRVRCLIDNPDENSYLNAGDEGVVVYIDAFAIDPIYRIDWGRDIDGHNCGGYCVERHGWNMWRREFELVEPASTQNFDFDDALFADLLK